MRIRGTCETLFGLFYSEMQVLTTRGEPMDQQDTPAVKMVETPRTHRRLTCIEVPTEHEQPEDLHDTQTMEIVEPSRHSEYICDEGVLMLRDTLTGEALMESGAPISIRQ